MPTSIDNEILSERSRQVGLWGLQDHTPTRWLPILAEEFGEVSREICEAEFTFSTRKQMIHLKQLRAELIQLAAVSISMIESLDRNELV